MSGRQGRQACSRNTVPHPPHPRPMPHLACPATEFCVQGTGKWTIQQAAELSVAAPTMEAALDARFLSGGCAGCAWVFAWVSVGRGDALDTQAGE